MRRKDFFHQLRRHFCLVAVAESRANDVARLKIHRVQRRKDGIREPDLPRDLAYADIEGDVWMFPLRYPYRIVQRCRNMRRAWVSIRRGIDQNSAQVHHLWRLLRESHRGPGHNTLADGQRNSQPAVEPSYK